MTSEVKKCPVCGEYMVHPVGVYVRTENSDGPILHTITSSGYTVRQPLYVDSSPRGVVIIREYLGECGHRWIEQEQFHKGSTYQEWQQLNPLVGPDCVIWRN